MKPRICYLLKNNPGLHSSLKVISGKGLRYGLVVLLTTLGLGLESCDYHRVFEEYQSIDEHEWHYQNPVSFEVKIDDTTTKYNLFVDLRHKNNYPYNNIWITLSTIYPNGDTSQLKNEFRLATKKGRWKGQNVGSVYDHRFLVKKNLSFGQKGTYEFQIEHLMRKDRLEGVMDVGVRLERSR